MRDFAWACPLFAIGKGAFRRENTAVNDDKWR